MQKKFKQLNVKLDAELDKDLIDFFENSVFKKSYLVKQALRSFIETQGLSESILPSVQSKPAHKIDNMKFREKIEKSDDINPNDIVAEEKTIKKRDLLFGRNEEDFMK